MTPIGRVSFVIDYFTILPQHNEYYTILLHHDKSRCALIDVPNVFIGSLATLVSISLHN